MRRWLFTFAGLLIWALHFAGVYVIASIGDVVARAEDLPFRVAALTFSVACLLATGAAAFAAMMRLRATAGGEPDFMHQLAALGAGVALIAILWQALPTVVGY